MSWHGLPPRHYARATQVLLKKYHCGGEPLATLCPISLAQDLDYGPPAPETNALSLDQTACATSCLSSVFYAYVFQICKASRAFRVGLRLKFN